MYVISLYNKIQVNLLPVDGNRAAIICRDSDSCSCTNSLHASRCIKMLSNIIMVHVIDAILLLPNARNQRNHASWIDGIGTRSFILIGSIE